MAESAPFVGIVSLVGLRGSGKSSLGRLLAERLDLPFCDLDRELAERHGLAGESAGALLERVGLERFRELESLTLAACLEQRSPQVLATGGGVLERAPNRALLAAVTRCVWLKASPAELARRVALDSTTRPALTDLEPAAEMALLAERRSPLYAAASELQCETEGRSLESLADEIFRHLSR